MITEDQSFLVESKVVSCDTMFLIYNLSAMAKNTALTSVKIYEYVNSHKYRYSCILCAGIRSILNIFLKVNRLFHLSNSESDF